MFLVTKARVLGAAAIVLAATAGAQAAERVESAMLRKRIFEVSEQVAQLRTVLEPLAPPPALAADGHAAHNGGTSNGHGAQAESRYATLDRVSLRELMWSRPELMKSSTARGLEPWPI